MRHKYHVLLVLSHLGAISLMAFPVAHNHHDHQYNGMNNWNSDDYQYVGGPQHDEKYQYNGKAQHGGNNQNGGNQQSGAHSNANYGSNEQDCEDNKPPPPPMTMPLAGTAPPMVAPAPPPMETTQLPQLSTNAPPVPVFTSSRGDMSKPCTEEMPPPVSTPAGVAPPMSTPNSPVPGTSALNTSPPPVSFPHGPMTTDTELVGPTGSMMSDMPMPTESGSEPAPIETSMPTETGAEETDTDVPGPTGTETPEPSGTGSSMLMTGTATPALVAPISTGTDDIPEPSDGPMPSDEMTSAAVPVCTCAALPGGALTTATVTVYLTATPEETMTDGAPTNTDAPTAIALTSTNTNSSVVTMGTKPATTAGAAITMATKITTTAAAAMTSPTGKTNNQKRSPMPESAKSPSESMNGQQKRPKLMLVFISLFIFLTFSFIVICGLVCFNLYSTMSNSRVAFMGAQHTHARQSLLSPHIIKLDDNF